LYICKYFLELSLHVIFINKSKNCHEYLLLVIYLYFVLQRQGENLHTYKEQEFLGIIRLACLVLYSIICRLLSKHNSI